ncbi:IS630 family transposase, partial [Neisseria gonorrhoeae]
CLHEIAKHFDCTAAAVCHAPKQMRMARKKRPPLTKDKTRPK